MKRIEKVEINEEFSFSAFFWYLLTNETGGCRRKDTV